jgi:hypothetical protein
MILALFSAIFLARSAQAQEQAAAAGTDLGGDARYVHNSPQGNQGFVRMFDGNRYDIGELDLFAHSGWDNALLNFNLDDIRSGNENGSLDFSWGSAVSLKGNLDILTARTPYESQGLVIDNIYTPHVIPDHTGGTSELDSYKRNFQDEEITFSLPSKPEYRIFAGNWLVQDRGDQALVWDNAVYTQSIDRFTREDYAGLDLDIGKNGQAYYEYAFRKFADYAQTPTTLGLVPKTAFNVGNQDVNSNKVAFRYNPRVNLSFAGGFTTRSRDNKYNGFTQYDYSGNLSSSYRPSKDLSLSARLYETAYQNKTDNYFTKVNSLTSPAPIDFLFLKADIMARYTGINDVVLTAAYKPEYTHRSGAQNWIEWAHTSNGVATYGAATYQNAIVLANNTQSNQASLDDTKHNFQAGITLQLPKDVELEFNEHYLMANRAAYENQPTQSDEHSMTLTVPLPQRVYWMGNLEDSRSENERSNLTNFKSTKDTVMTGLNWSDAKSRGTLGLFYTYEQGTDTIDAWFGISNTARGGAIVTPLIHEAGAPYNYTNNVLTISATAKPVEKLTLAGDVSYTDSEGTFLTSQVFDPYFNGAAAGSTFQSFNPTDLRILRFGLNARYELSKRIALRAGYRHEAWVDRVDSTNDGRDDVFDLGVNAKF